MVSAVLGLLSMEVVHVVPGNGSVEVVHVVPGNLSLDMVPALLGNVSVEVVPAVPGIILVKVLLDQFPRLKKLARETFRDKLARLQQNFIDGTPYKRRTPGQAKVIPPNKLFTYRRGLGKEVCNDNPALDLNCEILCREFDNGISRIDLNCEGASKEVFHETYIKSKFRLIVSGKLGPLYLLFGNKLLPNRV